MGVLSSPSHHDELGRNAGSISGSLSRPGGTSSFPITMKAMALIIGMCSCTFVEGLPVQMQVTNRNKECLYEHVKEEESFTVAAYVLGGSELRAKLTVTGPVAPLEAQTAMQIMDGATRWDKGNPKRTLDFYEVLDFETHNLANDPFYNTDEEEGDSADNVGTGAKAGETAEERRNRRAQERKRALEARHRREKQKLHQKRKVRSDGSPFEMTWEAEISGWYRVCMEGVASAVTVELDLRKESDYGGLHERTGHVLTLEEQALEEEEKFMEEDSAWKEGIKDEDFQSTREKLKTLRRLLADIQSKQNQERHRLKIHAATNEHSHSRMVLSSLLETVLFMLVTGYQVFTIRRWFKGAPVLGR